jgi:predicted Fe-Mo cluster-binding NifX family protein
MKIAIPTSDGIRISSNLHNIKGFKVFEITGGKIVEEVYVSRKKAANNPIPSGDNGDPAALSEHEDLSILSGIDDCQIVIANGVGKKMFEELVRAHKEVYITEASHVRGAINHFIRQTLRNHPEIA